MDDSLNEESEYYLISENIFDKFGNVLEYQATSFTVNTETDTVIPNVTSMKTDYPKNQLALNEPEFIVNFSDGVNRQLIPDAVKLFDNKKRSIPLSFNFIDDASVKVLVNSKLESRSVFELHFDLTKIIDLAGNRGDTVRVEDVSSINELDFTGVSGRVITDFQNYNLKVMLEAAEKGNRYYSTNVDSSNNYQIEKVVPGNYLIWAYDDKDSSNTYSYGNIFPFRVSEKFAYYPDTLNLRARWPVGDVFIKFD
jgi:hypothetical protein